MVFNTINLSLSFSPMQTYVHTDTQTNKHTNAHSSSLIPLNWWMIYGWCRAVQPTYYNNRPIDRNQIIYIIRPQFTIVYALPGVCVCAWEYEFIPHSIVHFIENKYAHLLSLWKWKLNIQEIWTCIVYACDEYKWISGSQQGQGFTSSLCWQRKRIAVII